MVPGRRSWTGSSKLIKSVVSLTYEGVVDTIGCRKWSTSWEIRSVGLLLAETMGLPGTGVLFLCIFGSKYNWEVRGWTILR